MMVKYFMLVIGLAMLQMAAWAQHADSAAAKEDSASIAKKKSEADLRKDSVNKNYRIRTKHHSILPFFPVPARSTIENTGRYPSSILPWVFLHTPISTTNHGMRNASMLWS